MQRVHDPVYQAGMHEMQQPAFLRVILEMQKDVGTSVESVERATVGPPRDVIALPWSSHRLHDMAEEY